MIWPTHHLPITLAALLLSSCSCQEDSGADAGPQPVDPEVQWTQIQSGTFTFGSPPGTPCMGPVMEKEVPVTLTRPFLISKYEITQEQWKVLGFPLPHLAPDQGSVSGTRSTHLLALGLGGVR